MECQRAEEGEKEETHSLVFSCSSLDMFGSFPPTDLCTPCSLPCQSHLRHPNSGRPFYQRCSHSQSHLPNLPGLLSLFLHVALLPLTAFFFFFLLPEILLFVVTTCFQKYLYETPPNESISSGRADIALSGDKAGVTQ